MLIDDVITPEDNAGQRDDCYNCAVARLLKRHVQKEIVPVVTGDEYYFKSVDNPFYSHLKDLSPDIQDLIRSFDSGQDVTGHRVVIEIPDEFCCDTK